VNGSGTLICAATAVSAAKKSTDTAGTRYAPPATSRRAVADVRTLSSVVEVVADIAAIVLPKAGLKTRLYEREGSEDPPLRTRRI
jgi:hypothetical protein